MNFTTLEFLLFFPLVALLYRLLPQKMRPVLLLLASYLFYAWWNLWATLLLLGISAVTWFCAGKIAAGRHSQFWLGAALCVTLGNLLVFKYLWFLPVILPVGISFYTFQSLSYVLDVRRGMPPERQFYQYALFIAFFPQLVAGPIERPQSLLPQLHAAAAPSGEDLRIGGWLMLRGFLKKLALADLLAPFVDSVYVKPEAATGPGVVLATVAFALQIYGDFSGYSDIAVGAARVMGIRLMQNFRCPYFAHSLRDFWRRWHISLTKWFTDYVYIPLGGSRRGRWRTVRNILIVFLLSGAWHGAAWHYVVWGGIHGLLLSAALLWPRPSRLPAALQVIKTFAIVCFAWVFFRAGSVREAFLLLAALPHGWANLGSALAALPVTALPALACTVLLDGFDAPPKATGRTVFAMLFAIAAAWVAVLAAGAGNVFIYFQF